MKKSSILLIVILLSGFLFYPKASFSLAPYDYFSGSYIDREKWIEGEFTREIDPVNHKLISKYSTPNPVVITEYPYVNSNNLSFSNPGSVNSIQTDVSIVESTVINSAETRARVGGRWYNDGTPGGGMAGDIWADVRLQKNQTGYSAHYTVLKYTNADGSTSTSIKSGKFTTTVTTGTAYILFIGYNSGANQFTFKIETETVTVNTANTPALPARAGNALSPWKGFTTRAQADNASSSSYIYATFSNVYKNGGTNRYDEFSSSTIDSTKWTAYEFVREISGGKLRSSIRSSSASTSSNYNYLDFVDPSSINVIQAKVTPLTYENTQGADIIARLGGRYYNDGTPGGGYLGEVGAEVRIGGTGTNPVGQWVVWTYSDVDGSQTNGIASGDFTKAISLNNTYTLLLGWDGNRFTFHLDDEVLHYTPTTSINPPNLPWKGLATRVRDPAGKEALIEVLFDDVMVRGKPIFVSQDGLCGGKSPCFTTIQNGIDSADAFAPIYITQETYNENVILDDPKALSLEGGCDTSFTNCLSMTTINGSLTISDGTLVVENIILQ